MTTSPLQRRRQPSQARGRQRVEALLKATAVLLEELGYDALTTKAIAERAETSIGSFYQFFPNRDAAVAALVDGYEADVRAFLQSHAGDQLGEAGAPIGVEWIGSLVDGLSALYATFPGFHGLWAAQVKDNPLQREAQKLRDALQESLDAILRQRFPKVPAEARSRCLIMVIETGHSLLNAADAADEPRRKLLQEELKVMLAGYMSRTFREDAP